MFPLGMNSTIECALLDEGFALVPAVLSASETAELKARYQEDHLYRSTIDMAPHHFGSGQYRYYGYQLPAAIQRLRQEWYATLAPIANRWNEATRNKERYPAELDAYIAACHVAGQKRPTPLILRYGAGDYNCMHQDVYGELGFPFQLTIPLSIRDDDFEGGETVLLEQAPRMQARPTVLRPQVGDALIFPNRYRPHKGACGKWVRYNVRHGVGTTTRGERYALGIIFHDAK
ncbi:MAG: 2OG-Fe(II) oxygenase [Candidatus Baltobacteraceae bacterium]